MNNKISQLYLSGQTASQIARSLGLTKQTVLYHIRRQGIPVRSSKTVVAALTASKQSALLDEYKAGRSQRQLSIKYGISIYAVGYTLRKLKIPIRSLRQSVGFAEVRLPEPGEPFFYYYIGLMLTDGWIYRRKYSTIAGLGSKDKNVVEYIRDRISPARKIYCSSTQAFSSRRTPADLLNKTKFHRIIIPISDIQADMLGTWGVIPRKTLTLTPTPQLRAMSDIDFAQLLVGMIEGDGSVINKNGVVRIYLYSTDAICRWVLDRVGYGCLRHMGSICRCSWTYRQARNLGARLLASPIREMDRKWSKLVS